MPRVILKLAENEYVEWSTIVDAPISFVMNVQDFMVELWNTRGQKEAEELIARVARADVHGSSYLTPTSMEEVIRGNRAGPNETEISLEEIRRVYRRVEQDEIA